MADLRPWLKLWKTAYADAKLSRLSMEDRGRWVWLLLYVGLNGEGGRVVLATGLQELRNVLALKDRKAVRECLDRLPGVACCDAVFPSQEVTITFTKWSKFQEDNSAERTRAWRQRKRYGDGNIPSQVTESERHKMPIGDGVRLRSRREEKPPLPPFRVNDNDQDFDTGTATKKLSQLEIDRGHIRINIPDDQAERRKWEAEEEAKRKRL